MEMTCDNCKFESLRLDEEPCASCKYGIPKSDKNHSSAPLLWELETVNHPAHYQGTHECIDEMIALFGVEAVKAFCKCNVYKYRYRAAEKNGQEDLAKADWYMEKLMELEGVSCD